MCKLHPQEIYNIELLGPHTQRCFLFLTSEWAKLLCNNYDLLQIEAIIKHSLLLINISQTQQQTFMTLPLICRFLIYETQASLLGILISFVNNFWLNISCK
jgi:hypothetical protein